MDCVHNECKAENVCKVAELFADQGVGYVAASVNGDEVQVTERESGRETDDERKGGVYEKGVEGDGS